MEWNVAWNGISEVIIGNQFLTTKEEFNNLRRIWKKFELGGNGRSSQLLIVIPAIKKNAVIPDQLVKKLNGITLIQRAIDTAKEITDNIFIITDSEEISLIAQRNSIGFYRDAKLKLSSKNILDITLSVVEDIAVDTYSYIEQIPL